MGSFLKQRIEVLHVHIPFAHAAHISLWHIRLRQFKRHVEALLRGDELIDALHLWRIHEGTLHADRFATVQIKHIASSYQLLGTWAVENGARVNHSTHAESNTTWEVGLDGTSDDVRGRTLSSNNHVNTYGTGLLGYTCDRQLDLFASGHNEVAELIDNHDDVRHKAVTVLRIELAVDEFLVVFLDVTGLSHLQQVVTGVHLLTQ